MSGAILQARGVECECPEEHTITKLGHCRTCPYYAPPNLWSGCPFCSEPADKPHKAGCRHPDKTISLFVCGNDRHDDEQPHDFGWATYCDETQSYGVCRCGLSQMSHDLMRLP